MTLDAAGNLHGADGRFAGRAMSVPDATLSPMPDGQRIEHLAQRCADLRYEHRWAGGGYDPVFQREHHELYDEFRIAQMLRDRQRQSTMAPAERAVDIERVNRENQRRQWRSVRRRYTPRMQTDFDQVWRQARAHGVVFCDLETTTVSPDRGHVLESAFRTGTGEELHAFHGVPAAHRMWNGTGAQHVHEISEADVEGLPALMDDDRARQRMRDFIGDRVVVAHNAEFEQDWLTQNGVPATFLDTKRMFGCLVLERDGAEHTSATTRMQDMTSWAGVPYENAHRAIGDARMLSRCFARLVPLVEGRETARHGESA